LTTQGDDLSFDEQLQLALGLSRAEQANDVRVPVLVSSCCGPLQLH
jgi:hypothetical protein